MKKKIMAIPKECDWCDDETFAEIKKKFNKDGAVLSREEIEKIIRDDNLKLKQIVKEKFN